MSGPTFAFAVGSFLTGGSDDGNSPLTSLDVHLPPSLLAVDMANRETVGRTRLVEGQGCWHALLHLSWVISTQVSWQGGGHLHTREHPWPWPLGSASMPFPRILASSGPTAQSAVIHLVVAVKAALAIEVGGCAGDAATLRCG